MTSFKGKPVSLFVYFTLWCLYSLQGPLYPTGSPIAKVILLILLAWSIVVMVKVNMQVRKGPHFLRALNAFLLLTTIYGLHLILSGQELYITVSEYRKTSNFDYLKNIYMSLLPIYVFYDYTKKRQLTESVLTIFCIILLLLNILTYFYSREVALLLAAQKGISASGITLNVGYNFLALLPLLFFWNKRPLFQYVLLFIILFFILICMKRGAILIGAMCFMYFIFSMFRNTRGNVRVFIVLLSIAALSATIYIIGDMISTNDYFSYRVQQTLEGDTSKRDQLYATYFNHFITEQNFFKFMFGNGANATLKIGDNFAHNDWLEIAINNGVLGLLLYLGYYTSLMKDYFFIRKYDSYSGNILLMTLIIMFSSSLFSMSYASLDKSICLALGYVLAQRYKLSKNLISSE